MIEYKNIYFIGIGGIGMSAIARMLREQGATVSGSDASESDVTRGLQESGIHVNIGQNAENLSVSNLAMAGHHDGIDCVVYTTAIPDSNPELSEARLRGLPTFTYAEMLGKISANFETIAVAGTHGKTTTTAMLASAFSGANLKPHVIVGSLLPEYKSNYLKGGVVDEGGNILITEACEYKRSFLNLNPKHVVITNIEEDHLDYYSDLADIQSAFIDLCAKTPKDGKIICNPDLPNLAPIVEKFPDKIVDYKKLLSKVPELKVLGEHNKLNAAATLALMSVFEEVGKNRENSADAQILDGAITGLEKFSGTWRRLEARGETEKGAILYDDYAHHPEEIRAGINALHQNFQDKKLVIFFQPHLYSRTKKLFDEFVEVFLEKNPVGESKITPVSELYLLPIYAAREPADSEISSEILAQKITEQNLSENSKMKVEFLPSFEKAAEIALEKDDQCVVVTMGAGDVYKILDLVK